MLSSMMSTVSSTLSTTSAITAGSALSTASSVMGMFSTIGVSEFSVITVVCLIVLLSASEILSASNLWNKRLSTLLNLAIIPMVITFFLIVTYNIIHIIYT
jgi:hypothetical protein